MKFISKERERFFINIIIIFKMKQTWRLSWPWLFHVQIINNNTDLMTYYWQDIKEAYS